MQPQTFSQISLSLSLSLLGGGDRVGLDHGCPLRSSRWGKPAWGRTGQGRAWHGSSLPFLDMREKRRGNDESAKKERDKCV